MVKKLLKDIFKDSIEIKQLSLSSKALLLEVSIENTYKEFLDSLGANLNVKNINPDLLFEVEVEIAQNKEVNYRLYYKNDLIIETLKAMDLCSEISSKGSEILLSLKEKIINETVEEINKLVDDRRNCFFYNLPEDVYHNTQGLSKSQLTHIIDKTYAHYEYNLYNPKKDTKALSLGRAFHCYILTPDVFDKRFFVTPKLDLRKADDKKVSIYNKLTKSHLEHISQSQLELLENMKEKIENHPILPLLLKNSKKEVSFYWENAFKQISRGRMDAYIDQPSDELKQVLLELVPDYRGQKIVWDLKTEESDASLDAYSRKILKYNTHVQGAYYCDGLTALTGEETIFILVVVEKTAPHCVAWYKLGDASIDKGQYEYKEAQRRIYSQKSSSWKGYNIDCQIIDIPYFKIGKAA